MRHFEARMTEPVAKKIEQLYPSAESGIYIVDITAEETSGQFIEIGPAETLPARRKNES
jgi:hypothetical protein